MKKLLIAAVIAALPLTSVLADSHGTKAYVKESQAAIKDFFSTLKGELVTAMKDGGPIHAIAVCSQTAPALARIKSQEHDMDLGRTSLKYRNPNNAPDQWEQQVLLKFEKELAEGKPVGELAYWEVVENRGGKQFRLMKAIPTGEVCLKCHGQNLDPRVEAKLDELYPNDLARGYQVGDIRGAFTITKDL